MILRLSSPTYALAFNHNFFFLGERNPVFQKHKKELQVAYKGEENSALAAKIKSKIALRITEEQETKKK